MKTLYTIEYVARRDSDQPVERINHTADNAEAAAQHAHELLMSTAISKTIDPDRPPIIGFIIRENGGEIVHRWYAIA